MPSAVVSRSNPDVSRRSMTTVQSSGCLRPPPNPGSAQVCARPVRDQSWNPHDPPTIGRLHPASGQRGTAASTARRRSSSLCLLAAGVLVAVVRVGARRRFVGVTRGSGRGAPPPERGDHQGGSPGPSGGVEPAVTAMHDPGRLTALVEADRRVGAVGPFGGRCIQGRPRPGTARCREPRAGPGRRRPPDRRRSPRSASHPRRTRPRGRAAPPRGRRWAPTSRGVEPRARSVVARILLRWSRLRAAGPDPARHHPSSLHHSSSRA